MTRYTLSRLLAVAALAAFGISPARGAQVCSSVPDLASLVQEIGGQQVSVTTFAKGTEDPHFIDAKPSFIKSLSQANLLVVLGLGMEDGWSPVVLQGARNQAVLPGAAGYLDASTAIQPLQAPTGPVDRAQGDVHVGGNPHYLLDPVCGLLVARSICARLSQLQPAQQAYFEERYQAFRQRTNELLVGDILAKRYKPDDIPKLCLLFEHGKLGSYLKSQREESLLAGWLGMMLPYYGALAVDDHNMWPYFSRRFGIRIVAHMEPIPGVPPTTQHLGSVVQLMQSQQVRLVLANPYYDPRHAQFLASSTGARVVPVAHQVGSRAGAEDYLSMVDYNVRQMAEALRAIKGSQ